MSYTTTSKVYQISGLTSNDVNTTKVEQFITYAENLINEKTGRTYESTTSNSEYFSNDYKDYDKSMLIDNGVAARYRDYNDVVYRYFLNNKPISQVNNVYLLKKRVSFNEVWKYDNNDYVSISDEVNNTDDTFNLFSNGNTDDVLYLGCEYRFTKIWFNFFTTGSGGTVSYSYYNGNSWTSLSVTDNTNNLTSNDSVSWDLPSDWSNTSVNNENLYWIKISVSSNYSTNPLGFQIRMDNNYVIKEEYNLNKININYKTGEIVLLDNIPLSGVDNIRIDYDYGLSTVPTIVEQLCGIIASISALGSLIGSTYNDITRGRTLEEEWATGEQYINIKNAISELRFREERLWKLVPKKVIIGVI